MISTRLYELAHRCRCEGKTNAALPLSWDDFVQLSQELSEMQCQRALKALQGPMPKYCGMTLSIEMD